MNIFLHNLHEKINYINSSSLFEKILTNKYELLTYGSNNKNTNEENITYTPILKFYEYLLPPLIHLDKNTEMMLLLDECNIKNNDVSILIFSNKKYYNKYNILYISDNKENIEDNEIHIDYFLLTNIKIINFLENSNNIIILFDNLKIYKKIDKSILINICLSCLSEDGNLFYDFDNNEIKLLNSIYKLFYDIHYHENIIDYKKIGFITFCNFKKSAFCKCNFKKNALSLDKKNALSLDKKFMSFLYSTYDAKLNALKKRINHINYIRENENKIKKNIEPYITTLINNGIDFCNKYEIKYNPIYDNFKQLNEKEFIHKYFKKFNNVNLDNVKISLDSNYSITLPLATEKLCKIIKKEIPSIKYIIDGNANIGSTGIYMSTFFNHIYSVELVNTTYDILVHNIKEYYPNKEDSKITPFNESIIDFMKNCKKKCHNYNVNTYCLFLDPPWTGVFYKTELIIDLYFDKINIIDFIKSIDIKYVCLKVPFNYNFGDLYKAFYKIIIHRLNGFFFVIIHRFLPHFLPVYETSSLLPPKS